MSIISTSGTLVQTYNMFLSSSNRTSGVSGNFDTSLFKPIILSNPNNWFTVRVGSCEIPYVFKLINSLNNVINFSMMRSGIPYSGSFTLSPGNYNILTLLTEIKTKLGSAISTLTGWNPSALFSFTYDRSAGFVSFTVLGTDSINTSITISDNSSVFLRCVGMSTSFTFGYTTPTARTTSTSSQNVNVSQNTALYVRSESFTQTTNIENIVIDNEVSDILAKVQINSVPQSYILWTNPTDLEVKISNRIIDTVNLYLGSSTSYRIDMGNLDWSVRLTVHEWTHSREKDDYAINLSQPLAEPTEEVKQLLDERQRAMDRLQKLRSKIK